MAKYIPAGNSEVWLVPTIASQAAPTAAEMNAGTRLTGFIRGGVSVDFSSQLVETGTLLSGFNSQAAGTFGGGTNTISGILRDNTADTAWTALPRGTTGYLAVQRGVSTGESWAAADVVSIYPWEVVARKPGDLSRDQLDTFDVDFAITAVPSENVAVV